MFRLAAEMSASTYVEDYLYIIIIAVIFSADLLGTAFCLHFHGVAC